MLEASIKNEVKTTFEAEGIGLNHFMKKKTLITSLAIISTIFLCISCSFNKGFVWNRSEESINAVKGGSKWVIEKGFSGYYKDRDSKTFMKNLKEHSDSYFYTRPDIDTNSSLFTLLIEHRWIHSSINCCQRLLVEGDVYEYWVVTYFSATRADVTLRDVDFIVTKSKTMTDNRIILKESNRFFKDFKINNDSKISFPVSNDRLLSWLKVWEFPEAFKGTELEGVKLEYLNGGYKRISE